MRNDVGIEIHRMHEYQRVMVSHYASSTILTVTFVRNTSEFSRVLFLSFFFLAKWCLHCPSGWEGG